MYCFLLISGLHISKHLNMYSLHGNCIIKCHCSGVTLRSQNLHVTTDCFLNFLFFFLHLSHPPQDISRISLSLLGPTTNFSPTLGNNCSQGLIRQNQKCWYPIAHFVETQTPPICLIEASSLCCIPVIQPHLFCPSEDLTKLGTCLTSSLWPFITHRQRQFPPCACYSSALPTSLLLSYTLLVLPDSATLASYHTPSRDHDIL